MSVELSKRQLQIGEEIRRKVAVELNDLIDFHFNNDFLTIMKAVVSKDLRYCKIYYRCKIENQKYFQEQLDGFNNQIANFVYKKLKMRIKPEIHFIFDETMIVIDEIGKVVEKNKEFIEKQCLIKNFNIKKQS